jgi:ribosome-associated toxin RatA of RatAB toxin-antitoxin module
MRTVNSIEIRAPWRQVFETAAKVELWPLFLSHYRWVRVLSGNGDRRVVEMAAHRDGIPCKWTSDQFLNPKQHNIRYRHIQSRWTYGMEVWWILTPKGDDKTEVLLTHDMAAERGLKGWFRQKVVGDFFVHAIADRTLAGVKRHLELR